MIDTQEIMPPKKKRKPIISILSTVVAAISMLPMLGIASLVGLVLGIVGFFRERHVTAIIGTVLSAISLAFSPTAWALLASIWLGVYCNVADCGTIISNGVQRTLENPKNQQMISDIVQSAQSVNFFVGYPAEWQSRNFDETPDAISKSVYAKSAFLMSHYKISPNYKAIFMDGLWSRKVPGETLDAFITKHIDEKLRSKYPTLQVTMMDPVTINNKGNKEVNKAQMRLLSGSSLGTEEVVAYIDGGTHVFTLILAAPNRAELVKAWQIFSDVLINGVSFTPIEGTAAAAPPTVAP